MSEQVEMSPSILFLNLTLNRIHVADQRSDRGVSDVGQGLHILYGRALLESSDQPSPIVDVGQHYLDK